MKITCNGCGQIYSINPSAINAPRIKTRCKSCNETIIISKPSDEPDDPAPEVQLESLESEMKETSYPEMHTPPAFQSEDPSMNFWGRIRRFDLRSKMILLFVVVPLFLMAGAILFTLNRMDNLSNRITDESNRYVTQIAQSIIAEKGRAVASMVKLYLETHPNLAREDFQKDPEFKALSVLKVGETGYTVVINGITAKEPCRIWAHPKDNLIGVDIIKAVYEKQGQDAGKTFERILTTSFKTKKESEGYYRFLDGDKYMVVVPVEGTNLFIPSTTYIPEFTLPMKELKNWAAKTTGSTLFIVIMILAFTAFLISAIAIAYGNRISRSVLLLTDLANKISIGQLDTQIDITSKNEFGVLGEAISRMQESIRIAIERIKRRH